MSSPIQLTALELLRSEYRSRQLNRENLLSNPLNQFDLWLNEAIKSNLLEPNAMILATANKQAIPSSRTVLLKKMTSKGFIFFTNYLSQKAQELDENPNASATFLWKELERQVIIRGKVEKIPEEESANYFAKRPRTSQLGAWASQQSCIIAKRDVLEEAYTYFEKLYKGVPIPLPSFWGGYQIIPNRIEFWQGRVSRLHDRFQYNLKSDDQWHIDRVAP